MRTRGHGRQDGDTGMGNMGWGDTRDRGQDGDRGMGTWDMGGWDREWGHRGHGDVGDRVQG